MDVSGKSDPYCKIKLESQEYKTKTIKKSLNPKWDELYSTKSKLIAKLKVTIKEARYLSAMDVSGKSDPYCKIKLESQEYKTKTIKKSLNPKWDQDYEFFVTERRAELEIHVFDWDRFSKDEFMGRMSLKIGNMKDGETAEHWYKLEALHPGEKVSGEILLNWTFQLGK
eukprot:TRINITY_DN3438_c0_g1_i1.p1 TRINITY_DN3438_c0_g1~~TRINITY_DN3438_c0_g1_i1.p1  ORF type:complete len:195 (+),score=65.14 TRINITY_DN3438_c0_g1_i1:80-586(+)